MGMGGHRQALAALPPGTTRYPLYRRLGGPQGRSGRVRKISPVLGFDPRTVQPIASRYTDWATPVPNFVLWHPLCMCPQYGSITLLALRIMRWIVEFVYCVPLIQTVCCGSLHTKCVRCDHLQGDCHCKVAQLWRHFLLFGPHDPYRYDLANRKN